MLHHCAKFIHLQLYSTLELMCTHLVKNSKKLLLIFTRMSKHFYSFPPASFHGEFCCILSFLCLGYFGVPEVEEAIHVANFQQKFDEGGRCLVEESIFSF